MGRPLSPALLARFRNTALNRIEKIEAGWTVLACEGRLPETEATVLRELHTLKGECSVGGFSDAAALAQSIEGLVSVARERGFVVSDDMDILATMALQFLRILVRAAGDKPPEGIDLPRFMAQIDELVSEEQKRPLHEPTPLPPAQPPEPAAAGLGSPLNEGFAASATTLGRAFADPSAELAKLSSRTRRRLATHFVATFIESAIAARANAPRFDACWRDVAAELASLESVALQGLLALHLSAAAASASALGKRIDATAEGLDVRVNVDIADALTTFVLHAVRNAVAHGIETVAERTAAGKPPQGNIRVGAKLRGGVLEVEVADDGRGIDFDAVRSRAKQLGELGEGIPHERELIDLLFKPGFTTADEVSEISGRGVGLDAARSTLRESGGEIAVSTQAGRGTTFTARVPCPLYQVEVHTFTAFASRLLVAVPAGWTIGAVQGATGRGKDPIGLAGFASSVAAHASMASPNVSPVEIELRRGDHVLVFDATSAPQRATALRVLPTKEREPVELVVVGEKLAVMIRPEATAS